MWICHIDFCNLQLSMPIFLANWTPIITSWAPISRNTTLAVCPPTWIANSVLSTMATLVAREVPSLSTTFGNEWETLWREWLSTTPLLSNKSIMLILQSLNLSGMGLKHVPLVSIILLLLSILTGITFGGESLSGRPRCLGFWLRGNERC